MSLIIGFWNINNKNAEEIGAYIKELIDNKSLDILLLSEYHSIEAELNKYLLDDYEILYGSGVCKKVIVIKRKSLDFHICTEGKRYLVLKSNKMDLVVVGLHLQDRRNSDDDERKCELNKILESSKDTKCKKTLYVGDFNCMPYDEELTLSYGMHAVLFKKEMDDNGGGKEKHYNPMLLMLNEDNQTYGSYRYIDKSHPIYWYAFDQVIVSKELTNSIKDIEYLKMINGRPLLSQKYGNPLISDHLPLVFRIGE